MAPSETQSRFFADEAPRVASLDVSASFKALTPTEQLYAYWLARASWAGAPIIMQQWTHSAVDLWDFTIALFSKPDQPGHMADLDKLKTSVSEADWQALLSYCAQCLSNLVNYKTFGDTKFIPRVDPAAFEAVVQASGHPQAQSLWPKLKDHIYSLEPAESLQIGKPEQGHPSAYYTWDPSTSPPTDAQVKSMQALCDANHVITTNTTLHKFSDAHFELRIASVQSSGPLSSKTLFTAGDQARLTFKYGQFSAELKRVNAALAEAAKYCESETREKMLQHYINSFDSGDLQEHKTGSKLWVTDAGPVVENYIGFIEAYVDPWCFRAEWEGFCSIVNKELSRKFAQLVDDAPQLIKCLPWGSNFEVDVFQKPDYTALEVVSFATGGIPAGINLPNYDEIRETHGFKNVSLVNILGSAPNKDDIKFLEPKDLDMFASWQQRTFEVQVANHELLGHGSGKLLMEREDGSFNFDRGLINPLTGKPVESWYKPGERPGSRLGEINGSMEECRAEAVAVFLCSNLDILKIFGYTDPEDIRTLRIMTYLSMSWAGLRALEYYDPKLKKHGQAHMRARFGIFKRLLREGIAKLNITKDAKSQASNVTVTVDEEAVLDGRGDRAVGDLLVSLQVLKATGDGAKAKAFYEDFTHVDDDEWAGPVRDFVIANKTARKLFVQPILKPSEGKGVDIIDFPTTYEGMIQSSIERNVR